MVHFPSEFPGDAARVIVTSFRNGTLATDRAKVAEAAWNLVGFGGFAALGAAPSAPLMRMNAPQEQMGEQMGEQISDEEAITALEAYETAPRDVKPAMLAGGPIASGVIVKWALDFLIRLLMEQV